MAQSRPTGFWVLIAGGLVLNTLFVLGQVYSLIDYERTVTWGLQEPAAEIGNTGMAFNFGFAVADTVFYVPVFLAGLLGLWQRKAWGAVALTAACGVSVYWPVMSTAAAQFGQGQAGFGYPSPIAYLPLTLPSFVYGVWGMWYLHTHRSELFD
ncbi:hypothetical protein ACFL12_00690 [Pseudomonadota bacterium]